MKFDQINYKTNLHNLKKALYLIMKNIALILCILIANTVQAQQRTCHSMEVLQRQLAANPDMAKAMADAEAAIALMPSNPNNLKTRASFTIPVVVHILHNGEQIGQGANISDAQVLSQIDALNEDFAKKNTDTLLADNPFQRFTSPTNIQFCLATKTSSGANTTGILRYNIQQSSVSDYDMDNTVKPQTVWNRDKYLNIWVAVVTAQNSILGYATFPGGPATQDGVVIQTTAFGYIGNVTAPYNNGRTAVHEVGHWLGLRHIWGDNQPNCGDDLVSDTKGASNPNYGCPTYPYHAFNGCGTSASGEMFMNYMDYVNDACMVMFTGGQAVRMLNTINNSRSGLATSGGCGNIAASVRDINTSAKTFLLPNPAHSNFEIYTADNTTFFTINLINASGQIVKQFKNKLATDGIIKTNLEDVQPGFYTVQLHDGKTAQYLKLVVN